MELAKAKFEVIIVYAHDEGKAHAVCSEILRLGGIARIFKADVTSEEEIAALVDFIEKTYGKIDVLVNNAGVYEPARIEDSIAAETWNNVLNINLCSKFLCSKVMLPLIKNSSYGSIINISSRAGSKPMEESVAYCCAASGINMLTKVSALEFAPYRIRVNAISPGLTRTPMTEQVDTEQDFIAYANANPSGRIGTPLDIANLAVFLASEKASYINGETIEVSGGASLL